ncbi:MAG TPA: glycosyltransferase family 1 protein [Jatrophihabitans sp.]|nr:glycosyltransferase family 1 protein [Jatrophihabitans sp.]
MRLLVDATAIPADLRGVGRYLDSLVPALAEAGVTVLVAAQQRDADRFAALGAEPVTDASVPEGRAGRLAWEQFGLPGLARRVAPDVLHSPHYTHPVRWRGPLVVTVHDTTYFSNPEWHTRVKGPFFRSATRLAVRRADVCVVDSHATAAELRARLGVAADRLQVAHLGVDTELFRPPPVDNVAAVRTLLGVAPDEEYIAFLGTLEPRKNVPGLIRGWQAAFAGRDRPPALVLAGGAGWDTELDAVAAAVPAGLRLLRPGYLPLEQLPGLLGGAAVVAYPSFGEGFGLPVLEAMACGTAVLTTRHLSLPEVGGNAVAYCETEAGSIGAALVALLDDPHRRAELGRAGVARAAEFSWAATAAAHLRAYERAIQRAGARA